MRAAHQHMVDHMGLSDVHFDATVENLVKALCDLKMAWSHHDHQHQHQSPSDKANTDNGLHDIGGSHIFTRVA